MLAHEQYAVPFVFELRRRDKVAAGARNEERVAELEVAWFAIATREGQRDRALALSVDDLPTSHGDGNVSGLHGSESAVLAEDVVRSAAVDCRIRVGGSNEEGCGRLVSECGGGNIDIGVVGVERGEHHADPGAVVQSGVARAKIGVWCGAGKARERVVETGAIRVGDVGRSRVFTEGARGHDRGERVVDGRELVMAVEV